MKLPSGLQKLTLGRVTHGQCLDGLTLPLGLQNVTFESSYLVNFHGLTLPTGLQSFTIYEEGLLFLSDYGVDVPMGLQEVRCGGLFLSAKR
jgi:hypothetical protein